MEKENKLTKEEIQKSLRQTALIAIGVLIVYCLYVFLTGGRNYILGVGFAVIIAAARLIRLFVLKKTT